MPTRLEQLVALRFSMSRSAAQEAIRNGRVDLFGERCDNPGEVVEDDAQVEYFPNRPKARKVEGRLNVLFEDRYLLIVEKPAGVLTLPTKNRERGTLLERASRYLTVRHGGRPYVGIVHRLDKETSGALVLARSPKVLRALQEMFRAHDIEREYLAVVERRLENDFGTIDRPIVSGGEELRRRVAHKPGEGRPAVTHYEVIERFDTVATVLRCRLETGRTHQIRIHLASIGHPVVGDRVYRPLNQPQCQAKFRRQALHARSIALKHPFTGDDLRVELEPPGDLKGLISGLRGKYGSG